MSRRDQAIEMAKRGIPPRLIAPRLIAPRLSIGLATVRSYIAKARQAGEDIPRFRSPGRPLAKVSVLSLQLNIETCPRLAPHAHARGLTVRILAQRLLEQIARDGLVEAVLDDATTHTNEGSNDDT